MVRIPGEEGYSASLPVSNHHQKCEDYKLQKYVRIEHDGKVLIETFDGASEFMDNIKYNDDAEGYTYMDIYMTQDQFEKLPEHTGW